MYSNTLKSDYKWMRFALEAAHCAFLAGEVPIGAVAVYQEQIVGIGYNKSISNCDPSAHAEIIALRKAAIKLYNYRMPGLQLYITVEPCVMCSGAIFQARCSRVIFGTNNFKYGAAGSIIDLFNQPLLNHHTYITGGVLALEAATILQYFFAKRRL